MGLAVSGDLSGTINDATVTGIRNSPVTTDAPEDGYVLIFSEAEGWKAQTQRWFDVNILTFGADPTGLTDSSAAIIGAVSAVSSTGGRVIIPKGTYLISSEIVLGNNISLEASAGAVLKKNSTDFNVIRISGNFSSVKGLEIDGYSKAQGSLILVTGANNVVSDCYLHDNGLMSDGSYVNGSHGISLDGQSTTCTGNIIRDNRIVTNHDIGISQHTAPDNKILNNDVSGSGLEGITIDVNSHRFRVIGNRITGNCVRTGVGGIGMDGSELGIISDNLITGTQNSLAGIKTQNNTGTCNFNIISNNIVLDNGGWGIWLFTGTSGSSSWCCVVGNVVRGNGSGSIRLESGCDNNQIRASSLNNVAVSNAGSNNTVN